MKLNFSAPISFLLLCLCLLFGRDIFAEPVLPTVQVLWSGLVTNGQSFTNFFTGKLGLDRNSFHRPQLWVTYVSTNAGNFTSNSTLSVDFSAVSPSTPYTNLLTGLGTLLTTNIFGGTDVQAFTNLVPIGGGTNASIHPIYVHSIAGVTNGATVADTRALDQATNYTLQVFTNVVLGISTNLVTNIVAVAGAQNWSVTYFTNVFNGGLVKIIGTNVFVTPGSTLFTNTISATHSIDGVNNYSTTNNVVFGLTAPFVVVVYTNVAGTVSTNVVIRSTTYTDTLITLDNAVGTNIVITSTQYPLGGGTNFTTTTPLQWTFPSAGSGTSVQFTNIPPEISDNMQLLKGSKFTTTSTNAGGFFLEFDLVNTP